jgi:hypothetical protein
LDPLIYALYNSALPSPVAVAALQCIRRLMQGCDMCSVRHIGQAGSGEEADTGDWLDRAKFPDRLQY